jgi:hypothetical protein
MEYNGYFIENDNTFGMKKIKTRGSGALPNVLKGAFTTHQVAMKAIDSYLADRERVKNGKETSTG